MKPARFRRHVSSTNLVLDFGPTIDLGAAGGPLPGLAPTMDLYSPLLGQWYTAGGPPFWIAGPAPGNAMLAVAGAPLNGYYTAAAIVPANIIIGTVGRDLYAIYQVVDGAMNTHIDYEHIHLIKNVWDELQTDFVNPASLIGSFGELMTMISATGFRFYRQFDHTYNLVSGQLESCKIRLYASSADAAADVNNMLELDYVVTYAAGKPTTVVSS